MLTALVKTDQALLLYGYRGIVIVITQVFVMGEPNVHTDLSGSVKMRFAVTHTHTHTHRAYTIGHIRWWNIAGQVTLYKQAYSTPYPGHLSHMICVSEVRMTNCIKDSDPVFFKVTIYVRICNLRTLSGEQES